MTRTRHHQAGYVCKKGSHWYLRYRGDVLLENGSIKRVQKCRKLAKAIGQCQTKVLRKSWPRKSFDHSTMEQFDQKVR